MLYIFLIEMMRIVLSAILDLVSMHIKSYYKSKFGVQQDNGLNNCCK